MLFLIRGLPGSGKTTLAKSMKCTAHIEADQWFESNPKIFWTKTAAEAAHKWCRDSVRHFLECPQATVVVANTFIRKSHVREYQELARALGHKTCVITCRGTWKSVHNVPQETLERMKQNWED